MTVSRPLDLLQKFIFAIRRKVGYSRSLINGRHSRPIPFYSLFIECNVYLLSENDSTLFTEHKFFCPFLFIGANDKKIVFFLFKYAICVNVKF